MTPEQFLANATTLAVLLLSGSSGLVALLATLAYGWGKVMDDPGYVRRGKNGWIGGGAMFVAAAIVSLLQTVAARLFS